MPKNDYIDLYISSQRNVLIREILDLYNTREFFRLFLYGGAGIGKTHILLDTIAIAKMKKLTDDFYTKPKFIIFYFLFRQERVNK